MVHGFSEINNRRALAHFRYRTLVRGHQNARTCESAALADRECKSKSSEAGGKLRNGSFGRRMPAKPAAAESSYRAASASPEKASFLVFQDMWTRQSNRERGTRQTADSEMRVLHAGFGNDDIMILKRPTEHRLKMRH